MYEFKIGDEVEVVADTGLKGVRFTVGSVTPNFVCEPNGRGWMPSSLKLVCPAGYRPVREDEMDESPRKGDAWLDEEGLWVVNGLKFKATFKEYASEDGEPWFRPLTTESVKVEPVVEETPVVKEDNNWGWMVVGSMTYAGSTDMGEAEAKAAAMRYSKDFQRTTLVFKVVGEYSTTCTTKWTPTDE